jgi:cytidylate kinase
MPIITISRGTFSGGEELAECLAERLGYPSISREVIVDASEQFGISGSALQAAMVHPPSILGRLTRDRDRYLAFVRAALCQHAKPGELIYHGHAGHHLLAGIRHLIRVRVVADMGFRIQAAMDRQHMTSHEAEVYIHKVDKERRKWTRFLYGVDWDDPANYDIVLNLEHLGLDGACDIVVRTARLEQFQVTSESQEAMEDLTLHSLVVAALANDERTAEADLHVEAHQGVVTVRGFVKQSDVVTSVPEVLRNVDGIAKLINDVAYTPPYPM